MQKQNLVTEEGRARQSYLLTPQYGNGRVLVRSSNASSTAARWSSAVPCIDKVVPLYEELMEHHELIAVKKFTQATPTVF